MVNETLPNPLWTSHATHVYVAQMPLSDLRKTSLREIRQKRDVTVLAVCSLKKSYHIEML